MTGLEGESAVMLFVVFPQLFKFCGAVRKFDFCLILSSTPTLKGVRPVH